MPPRETGRDEIASVVRLDRDRVKDVLDASGRMQERRGEAEMTDQSLREQVARAIALASMGGEHHWKHCLDEADVAIAASGVEGLQRSNDGLLDAIERLNEGQDRLRVENEQLRQLLDLPPGEIAALLRDAVPSEPQEEKLTVLDGYYATGDYECFVFDRHEGPEGHHDDECRVYPDDLLPEGTHGRRGRWTISVRFEPVPLLQDGEQDQ